MNTVIINKQVQNKVMEMFNIKSCKGVMIKNINRIFAAPPNFKIIPAFLSGIFFAMLMKNRA